MREIIINILLVVSLTGLANGIGCNYYRKYRTLNGDCNNLKYPYRGSSPRSHRTLLPLDYADGKICPKEATMEGNYSSHLPLARELSTNVLHVDDKPDEPNNLNELHVYFGLFLTHDITLTYVHPSTAKLYNCPLVSEKCPHDQMYVGPNEKYIKDTECLLLSAHRGLFCNQDGAYGKYCGCPLCKKGEFQQLNFHTSFIDLSNIYSTERDVLETLREPGSAKMRMTKDELIPLAPSIGPRYSVGDCVQTTNPRVKGPCLHSADLQGNLTPLLQAMNTLFLREHNRLVDKLRHIFKDPDVLFEEVRRITIAKMQHITYNEYLPATLGSCIHKGLKVPSRIYEYNHNLDATTMKEFVGGAFKFGHGQAVNYDSLGTKKNQIPTGQLYTLHPYYSSGSDVIEKMILGTMKDSAKIADQYYPNQTVNNVWVALNPIRSDLAAADIERTRQYGLQSYVHYRKLLNLEVPNSFDDLKDYMSPFYVENLKHYFGKKGLKNLDLFLGGIGEYRDKNCPGILFGPTFQRIIEEQFLNLKFGDRFWYENLNQPWSFTCDQLREIRKTTLSGLICLNTKLPYVLEDALVTTSKWIPCKGYAEESDINVAYWAKSDSHNYTIATYY